MKKTFICATDCKSAQLFFGSTEQERTMGDTSPLEKFFAFRGKSVEHSVKLLYM